MAIRKTIGKKLRFEVLKRDSFTCQYCGKMAPDVILEIDHIDSVKNGGKNDIMNLLTSCFDCNRGKGCRSISDNQLIKQQQEQLREISERREQLKLLLRWKCELKKFDDEQIDVVDNIVITTSNHKLSESGRYDILKTIKKYGISEVIEATKISFIQYYKTDSDTSKAVDYIPRICFHRLQRDNDPYLYKTYYIKGIIKNRIGLFNEKRVTTALTILVKNDESCRKLTDIAKNAKNWTCFWELLNDEFESDF